MPERSAGLDPLKKTVSAAQVAAARQNQRSWQLLALAGVPKRAKPEPLLAFAKKSAHSAAQLAQLVWDLSFFSLVFCQPRTAFQSGI